MKVTADVTPMYRGLPMMTDPELLTLYRRDQQSRNLRPKTLAVIHRGLRAFAGEMPDGLEAVTQDDVKAFLDRRRHISAKHRYWWLSTLHCFYAWGIRDGYFWADPTLSITRPRLHRSLPRPIPLDELVSALAEADNVMESWLLLGAYQGLRSQEIAGLSREDVLDTEGLLRVVHGKGGKERMIPLHPDVLVALRRLPMPPQGALFRRKDGVRMDADYVSHKITQYLHGCGSQSSAHALRHWFATQLYRGSHDLRLTQEMLGHQSPTTTAIYTAFDRRGGR